MHKSLSVWKKWGSLMVTEVDGEDGVAAQSPFSAVITIFNLGKKLGAWQCTIKISIAYKTVLVSVFSGAYFAHSRSQS